MVVVLGGLTIWLHKDWIIKMKPTFYYALVSGLLWFGLATDRPLLQRVLGSTYPGLDETGWTKLTRNWAVFFAFMALLNEAVWRNSSTNFWVGFKLWGALPLTFLFAAANIPMLLRHGLMKEDAVPAERYYHAARIYAQAAIAAANEVTRNGPVAVTLVDRYQDRAVGLVDR